LSNLRKKKEEGKMNIDDFYEKLLDDDELLEHVPMLKKSFTDENVRNNFYNLCRQIYLTQHNSTVVKMDDGGFGCFVSEENFKELRNNIEQFISELGYESEGELIKEVLFALERYYDETATHEENNSRTHIENNPKYQMFGHMGTYYNFNNIDWNYYRKGLGYEDL
jgi:hypothetical protein